MRNIVYGRSEYILPGGECPVANQLCNIIYILVAQNPTLLVRGLGGYCQV
jgi:hypothetical protein